MKQWSEQGVEREVTPSVQGEKRELLLNRHEPEVAAPPVQSTGRNVLECNAIQVSCGLSAMFAVSLLEGIQCFTF